MKKSFYILASLLLALPAAAQETYENAAIATTDLNGTARYVGMGGAMDALGADISTISSNPAGIGLFRHHAANVSLGMVMQQDADKFAGGKTSNLSFDQAGFVCANRLDGDSYLNLAFNYHKSRNFNYILSAADKLHGASQNKLSYMKGYEGLFDLKNKNGEWLGNSNAFNQVDYLYYNALMMDEDGTAYYNDASSYLLNRANKGYISTFDLNASGNIHDRVYLGLTLGIHDVHYKSYGEYSEALLDGAGNGIGSVTLADDRSISGTGFDLKAGIIVRPIDGSPFRFGLSIASPIFYDLRTENYTRLDNNTTVGLYDTGKSTEAYDFKLSTPWKFGLSLGHTIGSSIALGLGYEYADYSAMKSRINGDSYYDYCYDEYYDSSSNDREMNKHTSSTLKGVSTFKAGIEYKPISEVSFRAGYNFVSPMYKTAGFKDGSVDSPGSYYASATDYTNWKSTNRFTLGVGYTSKKVSVDFAFQYSAQKGELSPFMNYYAVPEDAPDYDNICNAVDVKNNRTQLMLTLGYHF